MVKTIAPVYFLQWQEFLLTEVRLSVHCTHSGNTVRSPNVTQVFLNLSFGFHIFVVLSLQTAVTLEMAVRCEVCVPV